MRVAILITARLGSTRLARKHLLLVSGKPILQFLVDAINLEFLREIANGEAVVAIATSVQPENEAFRVSITNCDVFAGSDENIPLRHLQAADFLKADAILSIDGDDILCSPRAMRAVYMTLLAGVRFAKTQGLPLGMNANGYSVSLLRDALERFGDVGALETGWGRIFDGVEQVSVRLDCPASERLRFTLDYQEDYCFFSALFKVGRIASGEAGDAEIVAEVESRGLDRITQPVVDEYWRNFNTNIDKEEKRRGE